MLVVMKLIVALVAFIVLAALLFAALILSKEAAIALPGLGIIVSAWHIMLLLAALEGCLLLALWWLFTT